MGEIFSARLRGSYYANASMAAGSLAPLFSPYLFHELPVSAARDSHPGHRRAGQGASSVLGVTLLGARAGRSDGAAKSGRAPVGWVVASHSVN